VVKCIKRGVANTNTFTTIHALEVYYVNQAGRGLTLPGIGPVYFASLYLQQGMESAVFRQSLPLVLPMVLWSGTNAVGHETLRTGGKFLPNITAGKSTDDETSAGDRVSKHITESAQNFIRKIVRLGTQTH